ncbi:MAG TPA: spore germination protein GerW family protein [Micromonosporaceae bacterium]|jgi:uncharacterized spore protein YtfJ
MKLDEVLGTARDAITVKRVYADPFEKDGVTIIPAAMVAGGGGGGGGHDQQGQEGEGGGFGMGARPAGAYVIKDGTVRWRPAVNVNQLAMVAGAVAVVYLLTRARIATSHSRATVGRRR